MDLKTKIEGVQRFTGLFKIKGQTVLANFLTEKQFPGQPLEERTVHLSINEVFQANAPDVELSDSTNASALVNAENTVWSYLLAR